MSYDPIFEETEVLELSIATDPDIITNEGILQDSQIISSESANVYNGILTKQLLRSNSCTSNECANNDDAILPLSPHLPVLNYHETNTFHDSQSFVIFKPEDNNPGDTHQAISARSISQMDMVSLAADETISSPEPPHLPDIPAQTDADRVSPNTKFPLTNACELETLQPLQSHYPDALPTSIPSSDDDNSALDQVGGNLMEGDSSPLDILLVHHKPEKAATTPLALTISTQDGQTNLPLESFDSDIRHIFSTRVDHSSCSNYSKTGAGSESSSSHESTSPDPYEVKLDPNLQCLSFSSSTICSPCSSPVPNHHATCSDPKFIRLSSPSSSLPSSSPPKIFSSSPPAFFYTASDEIAWEEDPHNLKDSNGDVQLPLPPSSIIDESTSLGVTVVLAECELAKGDAEVLFAIDPRVSSANISYDIASMDTSLDEDLHSDLSPPSLTPPQDAMSLIIPTKRKRSLGDMGPPALVYPPRYVQRKEDEEPDGPLLKRSKCSLLPSPPRPVPANKRPTAAFQKIQHKKLTTPFRSPAMKVKPIIPPTVNLAQNQASDSVLASNSGGASCVTADTSLTAGANTANLTPAAPVSTKVRTRRAGAQFKSPLSASSSGTISSVRLTPTIQALERNVQILKRAVKVRKNEEEEELERLVRKWTEAGREVAYELWELVKDSGGGDMSSKLQGKVKRGIEESWGWGNEKKGENDSWGWHEKEDGGAEQVVGKEELREDEERESDTLGTMLRQLGIAPETLGWDEEEGMFVGE